MELKEINSNVKLLMSNISLKTDFQNILSDYDNPKLLIVEGKTDKEFVKSMINSDVICISADIAFDRKGFWGQKKDFATDKTNNKRDIVETVYGLNEMSSLITCTGSDRWNIYGMIDMDYDDINKNNFFRTSHLFVTDTHDLETLLLYTDSELPYRLNRCSISKDSIERAFFIAYQLGVLKTIIYKQKKGLIYEINKDGIKKIDFDRFTHDNRIVVDELLKYLKDNNKEELPAAKVNEISKAIKKDKSIKKLIDDKSTWKEDFEQFEVAKHKDFWEIVNGHDIVSALKYLDKDVEAAYKDYRFLDREFEIDLIKNYEYIQIKKTKMYDKMLAEKVVKNITDETK